MSTFPATRPQQDMPFGVAAIFAVIGVTVLTGVLIGYVGPALWVRLAYVPLEAKVEDWGLAGDLPGAGGTRYKLEALLSYQVRDTAGHGWAKFPLITHDAPGPEMDAVLAQVQIGDMVTAYCDPFRPANHVVVDRNRFEGGMFPAVLFPS